MELSYSEYLLKVNEALENQLLINLLDTYRFGKKFSSCDFRFEFTINPSEQQYIHQELLHLKKYFIEDKEKHITIYIWKKSVHCLLFNGNQKEYRLNYIWFTNLSKFLKDLEGIIDYYYLNEILPIFTQLNRFEPPKEKLFWKKR